MTSPDTSSDEPLPSSFRDPSGFVFTRDGVILRAITERYQKTYDRFMDSGLYCTLADSRLLIPHEEIELAEPVDSPIPVYQIIRPETVPFISYPYEWCFGELQDAALATLKIARTALDHGMILKDASAYNIQFVDGKPVFIDTLSFEEYREGEPWVAYRQFCQHFLAPLALASYRDIRLTQLLRTHIDGVPLDLASALLPVRTRLRISLLMHLHLHAKSQRRHAGSEVSAAEVAKRGSVSKNALIGILDSLESAVKRLSWKPTGTEWANYYAETNYSSEAFEAKKRLVGEFLDRTDGSACWDLGANTGVFSQLAVDRGMSTVAFDIDAAAVEINYRESVKKNGIPILPLVLDLTNPSPGLGWANHERMSIAERGPVDVVLALALIHHLAISNNVPLDRIADFLAPLCRWLIIEFVPKSDSQVKRLLSSREDIFVGYTLEGFEAAFSKRFRIVEQTPVEHSERMMYLMESRVTPAEGM